MTNKIKSASVLVLLLTFFAAAPIAAQTEPLRDRIVAKPQPTPTAKPSNTPAPNSNTAIKPFPAASPSPTVSRNPANLVSAPQTLFDLSASIRRVLQNPALVRGAVGVKAVSLDSGKTLFEENAEKLFMPASNMKSFTVAAALDRLSPNFRFATSVYSNAQPDQTGTIRGDVTIFGRGDPTFAASLNQGDYYRAINVLADKIAASGVKRIEGNLIGDDSYFRGDALGSNWEWGDLQWYYGAEVSALTVNDNAVDLKITPGATVGAPLFISVLPANSLFAFNNLATTAPAGTKREISVTKRLGTNTLEIRGTMPLGDKGYDGAVAVSKPAEMFVALVKNALQQRNVVVTGQTRVVSARDKNVLPNANFVQPIEIVRHESATLSIIAGNTLKPSQNLYTELILRALGEAVGDKVNPNKTSAELGLEVVAKFLNEAGIQTGSVVQDDGSGLSRHNLITPSAAVNLYVYMSRHRFAADWQAAQTIAGVDGTLQNRFRNTKAAGNVRGKTGTLDQVGSLSGYLTTAGGERLAFSVLTNNLPDGAARRSAMDEITLLLTNFNGTSADANQQTSAK